MTPEDKSPDRWLLTTYCAPGTVPGAEEERGAGVSPWPSTPKGGGASQGRRGTVTGCVPSVTGRLGEPEAEGAVVAAVRCTEPPAAAVWRTGQGWGRVGGRPPGGGTEGTEPIGRHSARNC